MAKVKQRCENPTYVLELTEPEYVTVMDALSRVESKGAGEWRPGMVLEYDPSTKIQHYTAAGRLWDALSRQT